MTTEIRNTEDGGIEVCVVEDGLRECGFISTGSMHCVAQKANQLRAALRRKAQAALGVDPTQG